MRWLAILFILSLCSSASFARDFQPLAWLASWILPDGFREGYDVREFIASPVYDSLRKIANDRETLDALYEYAYYKTHGDERSAAFAMLVAVFEHRTIPLKLGLAIPLSFEEREAFERRVERLPRYIYNDTTDDRDKLQHFFSAAYAKLTLGMSWLVNAFGETIEIFEEKLVTGGANDRRDVVANRDGMRFALSRNRLPSEFLTK
jgi:hypothetical protein